LMIIHVVGCSLLVVLMINPTFFSSSVVGCG